MITVPLQGLGRPGIIDAHGVVQNITSQVDHLEAFWHDEMGESKPPSTFIADLTSGNRGYSLTHPMRVMGKLVVNRRLLTEVSIQAAYAV
jgi:hypothetical protein